MLRILVTIVFCAAATFALAADLPGWQSEYDRDHPLVGTVWTEDGRQASLEAVAVAAAETDYVLIGEIHPIQITMCCRHVCSLP